MDYKEVLVNMCSDSVLIEYLELHDNGFMAILRFKKTDNEDNSAWCNNWLADFSHKTNTNWIVRYTYPSAKRYLYRKVFKCQHSSFNKVKSRKKENTRIRDKECNATVDFLIKLVNRNTIKNDRYLRDGYCGCIKVSGFLYYYD